MKLFVLPKKYFKVYHQRKNEVVLRTFIIEFFPTLGTLCHVTTYHVIIEPETKNGVLTLPDSQFCDRSKLLCS